MDLAPYIFQQYFADDATPLNAGTIDAYEAGTVNRKDTYTSAAGDTPNANPFTLGADGRTTFYLENGAYDFVIKDSLGNVLDTKEDVLGGSSSGSGSLQVVDSIAALKALPSGSSEYVDVAGYYAQGDNRMRHFFWDETNASADNGGTIISPDSAPGTGRWVDMENGRISIKDFGATGDGSTDDTISIANCISAEKTGGHVFIPTGNYMVTKVDLRGATDFTFEGEGRRQSAFKAIDNSEAKFFHVAEDAASTDLRRCTIKNFRLSDEGNDNTYGWYGVLATDNLIENITIEGFQTSFYWDKAWINTVINCAFEQWTIVGVEIGESINNINSTSFIDCRNTANGGGTGTICWNVTGNSLALIGCDSEGSDTDFKGVVVTGGQKIDMINCHFEGGAPCIEMGVNATPIVTVVNIRGCFFSSLDPDPVDGKHYILKANDPAFYVGAINIDGCIIDGTTSPAAPAYVQMNALQGHAVGLWRDNAGGVSDIIFEKISAFTGFTQYNGMELDKLTVKDDALFEDVVSVRDNKIGYDADMVTLDYDAQTAVFTVGATLTGGTSEATGVIVADTTPALGDGTLYLVDVDGTFADGETITDDNGTPGSADADGTQVAVTDGGLSFNYLNVGAFTNTVTSPLFRGTASATPTLAPNDNDMQSALFNNTTAGAGNNNFGPRIGFGGPGSTQCLVTVGTQQDTGDSDVVGFVINVHDSSTGTDDMVQALKIDGQTLKAAFAGAINVTGDIEATVGLVKFSVEKSITASTTQSQGQQPLTKMINEISTVANPNDVVTMVSASTGYKITLKNRGANTLQIFPATGDNIDGTGTNLAVTLAAGVSVTYVAIDGTNWMSV